MPDVFTSNYDDLLEDAKKALKRSGRVRHFHGRLPQSWKGTRLSDPPVVTTRDYLAAEDLGRYEKIAKALSNKTALLVGFSLADPNLTRLIRANSSDCRAVVVASATGLTPAEQNLRLNLLRRYWQGLGIEVTAVEAREELPAFLFALRREVLARENKSFAGLGEDALKRSATASPWGWSGAREWRDGFRDAVTAAKAVAPELRGDVSLRAGFYAIQRDGYIAHVVSSTTTMRSHRNEPRRTLLADSPRPWGAAGYSFAAGVPILASTGTGAFDRNVNESDLLAWQSERAAAERLPASSVLCVPAWVRYQRRLIPVGVTYFSSRRARLVTSSDDEDELKSILQLTFGAMIDSERLIEGGPA